MTLMVGTSWSATHEEFARWLFDQHAQALEREGMPVRAGARFRERFGWSALSQAEQDVYRRLTLAFEQKCQQQQQEEQQQ